MPNQPTKLMKDVAHWQREREEEQAKEQATHLGLPYAQLVSYPASSDVLHVLDEPFLTNFHLIAFVRAGLTFRVATDRPPSPEALTALQKWADSQSLHTQLVFVSPSSFAYLANLRQSQPNTPIKLNSNEAINPNAAEPTITTLQAYAALTKQSSTTNLLDLLLIGAEDLRASDVHFEPAAKQVIIRLRIDGVLHPAASLTAAQYKSLTARMKLLANMKIDITGGPQDGRFGFHAHGRQIDIRMSSLPTLYGEGIVLRLLEQSGHFQTLTELGFRPDLESLIRQAIAQPYGIILVTGPTGSGKTTTLYALLAELNRPERKIMTLEDPIEYRLSGIVQSQVEPDKKFDFAEGLRGALRQDPDVIMVGEIRDLATADIAVNAALTGHLLLSTLHTNNAPASLGRLLNLGVKPYLLAGSINLLIAQRLVRKLCPNCAEQQPLALAAKETLRRYFPHQPLPTTLPRAKGCPVCAGTGYLGRIVIAEAFKPTTEFEALVLRQAALGDFYTAATEGGMIPMEQDGFWKVYNGLTTPEEVWRVTREDRESGN